MLNLYTYISYEESACVLPEKCPGLRSASWRCRKASGVSQPKDRKCDDMSQLTSEAEKKSRFPFSLLLFSSDPQWIG